MCKPVFISYSTDDSAITEQIRDGLEAADISCWMAPRDIAPGLDYGTRIIDAIEACTVLLLVLSESSNYSIYVRKEVERAIAKGKVVIPVRIQDVAVSNDSPSDGNMIQTQRPKYATSPRRSRAAALLRPNGRSSCQQTSALLWAAPFSEPSPPNPSS